MRNAVSASAPAATANAAIKIILRFTNTVPLIRPPFPSFTRLSERSFADRNDSVRGRSDRTVRTALANAECDEESESAYCRCERWNRRDRAPVRRRLLEPRAREPARRARRQRRSLTRTGRARPAVRRILDW